MADIKKKLSSLPLCPGVYIMKNKDKKIIYIGKAVLSSSFSHKIQKIFIVWRTGTDDGHPADRIFYVP